MNLEGLVLEAKYPELQYIVKGPRETVWKDGYPIQQPKQMVLYFDRFLCELDTMAKNQEWTDEDREFVVRQLTQQFKDPSFTDMWIHEAPKPGKPWPTYDDTHHNQVSVIAQSIGLVNEALVYEERGRPGGPRESVVKKLNELLGATEESVGEVEEFLAV